MNKIYKIILMFIMISLTIIISLNAGMLYGDDIFRPFIRIADKDRFYADDSWACDLNYLEQDNYKLRCEARNNIAYSFNQDVKCKNKSCVSIYGFSDFHFEDETLGVTIIYPDMFGYERSKSSPQINIGMILNSGDWSKVRIP